MGEITKPEREPEPVPIEMASVQEGKVDETNAADIVFAAEEQFTQEQYRKLLRKVDFIILPLMWVSSISQNNTANTIMNC